MRMSFFAFGPREKLGESNSAAQEVRQEQKCGRSREGMGKKGMLARKPNNSEKPICQRHRKIVFEMLAISSGSFKSKILLDFL